MGKHGKHGKKRQLAIRWASLAFCALFAAAIFLPTGYIIIHAGHEHAMVDGPCFTCACLEAAQSMLRLLSACAPGLAVLAALLAASFLICILPRAAYVTPVALKVRLNN